MPSIEKLLKVLDLLKPNIDIKRKKLEKFEKIKYLGALNDILHNHIEKSNNGNYLSILSKICESYIFYFNDAEADVRLKAEDCFTILSKSHVDYISRIQIELFKEIKHNGLTKSLKTCLIRFAYLFKLVRKQKFRAYITHLYPALILISQRPEEIIQEALKEFLIIVMPITGKYANMMETKEILNNFYASSNLSNANKRIFAEILSVIVKHSRYPKIFYVDLLTKLLISLLPVQDQHNQDTNLILGNLLCIKNLLEIYPFIISYPSKYSKTLIVKKIGTPSVTPHNASEEYEDSTFILLLKITFQLLLYHLDNDDTNICNTALESLTLFLRRVMSSELLMSYNLIALTLWEYITNPQQNTECLVFQIPDQLKNIPDSSTLKVTDSIPTLNSPSEQSLESMNFESEDLSCLPSSISEDLDKLFTYEPEELGQKDFDTLSESKEESSLDSFGENVNNDLMQEDDVLDETLIDTNDNIADIDESQIKNEYIYDLNFDYNFRWRRTYQVNDSSEILESLVQHLYCKILAQFLLTYALGKGGGNQILQARIRNNSKNLPVLRISVQSNALVLLGEMIKFLRRSDLFPTKLQQILMVAGMDDTNQPRELIHSLTIMDLFKCHNFSDLNFISQLTHLMVNMLVMMQTLPEYSYDDVEKINVQDSQIKHSMELSFNRILEYSSGIENMKSSPLIQSSTLALCRQILISSKFFLGGIYYRNLLNFLSFFKSSSNYWLSKINYLKLVSEIDWLELKYMESYFSFTENMCFENVTTRILKIVFNFLHENDTRIRALTSQIITKIIPSLFTPHTFVADDLDFVMYIKIFRDKSKRPKAPHSTPIILSLPHPFYILLDQGITHNLQMESTMNCIINRNLSYVIQRLLSIIARATDFHTKSGCIETLLNLTLVYPPLIYPSGWNILYNIDSEMATRNIKDISSIPASRSTFYDEFSQEQMPKSFHLSFRNDHSILSYFNSFFNYENIVQNLTLHSHLITLTSQTFIAFVYYNSTHLQFSCDNPYSNHWPTINDKYLISTIDSFMAHLLRTLAICCDVIEGIEKKKLNLKLSTMTQQHSSTSAPLMRNNGKFTFPASNTSMTNIQNPPQRNQNILESTAERLNDSKKNLPLTPSSGKFFSLSNMINDFLSLSGDDKANEQRASHENISTTFSGKEDEVCDQITKNVTLGEKLAASLKRKSSKILFPSSGVSIESVANQDGIEIKDHTRINLPMFKDTTEGLNNRIVDNIVISKNDSKIFAEIPTVNPTNNKTDKPPPVLGKALNPYEDRTVAFVKFTNYDHLPLYFKIYETVKMAYQSYLSILKDEENQKFYILLTNILKSLISIIEVMSFYETSKIIDELLHCLSITFTIVPSLTISALTQLLKSLFGTNLIYFKHNRFSNVAKNISGHPSFGGKNVTNNLESLFLDDLLDNNSVINDDERTNILGWKYRFEMTPNHVNAQIASSEKINISSYIRKFEDLVIRSLKLYTITSSIEIQNKVLEMLTQLIFLRVNYHLLDSDQLFLNFLFKQIEFIEQGYYEDCPKLIDNLFQFFSLLTREVSDSTISPAITLPKIINLAEVIIASDQSLQSLASGAYFVLIQELFLMTNTPEKRKERVDLDMLRDVITTLLLKHMDYPEIMSLIGLVLTSLRKEYTNYITSENNKYIQLSLRALLQMQETFFTPNYSNSENYDGCQLVDKLIDLFRSLPSFYIFPEFCKFLGRILFAPVPIMTDVVLTDFRDNREIKSRIMTLEHLMTLKICALYILVTTLRPMDFELKKSESAKSFLISFWTEDFEGSPNEYILFVENMLDLIYSATSIYLQIIISYQSILYFDINPIKSSRILNLLKKLLLVLTSLTKTNNFKKMMILILPLIQKSIDSDERFNKCQRLIKESKLCVREPFMSTKLYFVLLSLGVRHINYDKYTPFIPNCLAILNLESNLDINDLCSNKTKKDHNNISILNNYISQLGHLLIKIKLFLEISNKSQSSYALNFVPKDLITLQNDSPITKAFFDDLTQKDSLFLLARGLIDNNILQIILNWRDPIIFEFIIVFSKKFCYIPYTSLVYLFNRINYHLLPSIIKEIQEYYTIKESMITMLRDIVESFPSASSPWLGQVFLLAPIEELASFLTISEIALPHIKILYCSLKQSLYRKISRGSKNDFTLESNFFLLLNTKFYSCFNNYIKKYNFDKETIDVIGANDIKAFSYLENISECLEIATLHPLLINYLVLEYEQIKTIVTFITYELKIFTSYLSDSKTLRLYQISRYPKLCILKCMASILKLNCQKFYESNLVELIICYIYQMITYPAVSKSTPDLKGLIDCLLSWFDNYNENGRNAILFHEAHIYRTLYYLFRLPSLNKYAILKQPVINELPIEPKDSKEVQDFNSIISFNSLLPEKYYEYYDVFNIFCSRVINLGWADTHVFQEICVILSGALNLIISHSDTNVNGDEEDLEKLHISCVACQTMTLLVCYTILTPFPGNPLDSQFPDPEVCGFFKYIDVNIKYGKHLGRLHKYFSLSSSPKHWSAESPIWPYRHLLYPTHNLGQISPQYAWLVMGLKRVPKSQLSSNSSEMAIMENSSKNDTILISTITPANNNPPPPLYYSSRCDMKSCLRLITDIYQGAMCFIRDTLATKHFDELESKDNESFNFYGDFPVEGFRVKLDHSNVNKKAFDGLKWLPRRKLLLELIKSIIYISDTFCSMEQFDWMQKLFCQLYDSFEYEGEQAENYQDEILMPYLAMGLCKSSSSMGMSALLAESLSKVVEGVLKNTQVLSKIIGFKTCLYLLEANPYANERLISFVSNHSFSLLDYLNPSALVSSSYIDVLARTLFYLAETFQNVPLQDYKSSTLTDTNDDPICDVFVIKLLGLLVKNNFFISTENYASAIIRHDENTKNNRHFLKFDIEKTNAISTKYPRYWKLIYDELRFNCQKINIEIINHIERLILLRVIPIGTTFDFLTSCALTGFITITNSSRSFSYLLLETGGAYSFAILRLLTTCLYVNQTFRLILTPLTSPLPTTSNSSSHHTHSSTSSVLQCCEILTRDLPSISSVHALNQYIVKAGSCLVPDLPIQFTFPFDVVDRLLNLFLAFPTFDNLSTRPPAVDIISLLLSQTFTALSPIILLKDINESKEMDDGKGKGSYRPQREWLLLGAEKIMATLSRNDYSKETMGDRESRWSHSLWKLTELLACDLNHDELDILLPYISFRTCSRITSQILPDSKLFLSIHYKFYQSLNSSEHRRQFRNIISSPTNKVTEEANFNNGNFFKVLHNVLTKNLDPLRDI
ncbi:uncharacterized protein LOC135923203 isoform X2 [Gordionus sp. m RMFG-2023]|uniref:uncharacterized protein LOC135923203 isoform X2 n=1 Tax=Gordionus sp. m RMFG-2023 TaxID=3053472 RepID=UPI0031FCE100